MWRELPIALLQVLRHRLISHLGRGDVSNHKATTDPMSLLEVR